MTTFLTNGADRCGGGMYNRGDSNPPVAESFFCGNEQDQLREQKATRLAVQKIAKGDRGARTVFA